MITGLTGLPGSGFQRNKGNAGKVDLLGARPAEYAIWCAIPLAYMPVMGRM
jgi:hypothetical protein